MGARPNIRSRRIMGVVHKLTQEIVDFIIYSKKNNLCLSCRQMVRSVKETYYIDISKSAVNKVFKNAGLSQSIGRYPQGRKTLDVRRGTRDVRRKEQDASHKKSEENVSRLTSHVPRLKGMGLIFFKAAQWEISHTSFLVDLFRQRTALHTSRLSAACDAMLLLSVLGIKEPEDIDFYTNYALWALNDLDENGLEQQKELISSIQADIYPLFVQLKTRIPRHIIMEYRMDKDVAFLEAGYFKLILKDNSEFMLDSRLNYILKEKNSIKNIYPLRKAINLVSSLLISNNHNLVLYPSQDHIEALIEAFENLPGKEIRKVLIISRNDEILSEFTIIPSIKRKFMLGKKPIYSEKGNALFKKTFNYKDSEKTFYIREEIKNLSDQLKGLNIITLWIDRESAPVFEILTNQNDKTAEEILNIYLSNFPDLMINNFKWEPFDSAQDGEPVEPQSPDSQELETRESKGFTEHEEPPLVDSLQDIFNDFGQELQKYCGRHFFHQNIDLNDINNLMVSIYGLSGQINKSADFLNITLYAESCPFEKELKQAIKLVNQRQIKDFSGRRLIIQLF